MGYKLYRLKNDEKIRHNFRYALELKKPCGTYDLYSDDTLNELYNNVEHHVRTEAELYSVRVGNSAEHDENYFSFIEFDSREDFLERVKKIYPEEFI